MASRNVAVRLTAEVGSYVQGMKNATAATKDLASQTLDNAEKNKQAWNTVGTSLLAMGAAAGVGVGLAVKKYADFDQAMSNVQAATHESAAAMGDLREAALDAGAKTAFSATEAAGAIEELAKAGVSTGDILGGGLAGALDLAAAGSLDVGAAAEIAATALVQFGLDGAKVPHVADLLAAAAGKAQGSVGDMGMALKQVGLVANSTGLTIEETTAGLASFASAGLVGSDAGTSFKSMLQRLNPQSEEASTLMGKLGFSAYDAQGNFIGLEALAGELTDSFAGMTDEQRNAAMATLFGSDAVRAATVLYDQGAAGIADWTDKVNDQGYAAETAAIKLDNLNGDLEALGGSIETALIGSGSAANGVLREMAQAATGAVNAYSALPQHVQTAATGLGAVAAAGGLAGGALLLAVPKIAEFRTALSQMGPVTQGFASGLGSVGKTLMGPWGLALAAGVGALYLYGQERANAQQAVEEFTSAIQADSGAIGDNARALAANQLEAKGVYEQAERMGLELDLVTEAALGNTDAMAELKHQLDADGGVYSNDFIGAIEDSAEATGKAEAAARRTTTAVGEQKTGQDALGEQIQSTTTSIDAEAKSLSDLMAEVRDATGLVLGLRDASRGYEAALDTASEAIAENGRTLDITTEKGRANQESLDAIAASANDVLSAMIEAGDPLDSVSRKLGTQREALITTATRFGMTRQSAEQYTDSVLKIPAARTTNVAANTGAAEANVRRLRNVVEGLDNKTITVTTIQKTVYTAQRDGVGGGLQRASGGWAFGPGTASSDSIPAWLSNGEFVVNARSAGQNSALLEAINSNRYASGGWVAGRDFSPSGSDAASGGAAPVVHWKTEIYGTDDIVGRAVGQQARELAFNLATSG